jgi:hypothetical protein
VKNSTFSLFCEFEVEIQKEAQKRWKRFEFFTTYFTINCAEKLESPNQWHSQKTMPKPNRGTQSCSHGSMTQNLALLKELNLAEHCQVLDTSREYTNTGWKFQIFLLNS